MRIVKPYTNYQYAELAVYCNNNNCVIVDKGRYLESEPVHNADSNLETNDLETR